MSTEDRIRLFDDPGVGVILEFLDRELVDSFEDYLTEKRFVLFKMQESPVGPRFLFGEGGSIERVRKIFADFMSGED